MSIENITLFRNCMLSQAGCRIYEKALTRSISWNFQPLNVSNSTAGILGMGRSQKAGLLPMFPDFTALSSNLKLVQVGTQTVFEQVPQALADQGVLSL